MTIRTTLAGLALAPALALPLALPAAAQDMNTATAALMNTEGEEIGTATLEETASGLTHVTIEAEGISEGIHGVHIHETGDCGDGDFSAAGGHLAGDMEHGLVEGGPHPGDLPNAHVQSDGVLAMEAFKSDLDWDMLMDDDGAAFVIHAGADDYESQPSGDAGDRVACGVFEAG
ncbi:superoxide dismutase family protein [Mesobaculum littorinae]|uniref:Superoxide dismutase family protein n=1 Tax=Mesobaculum littorinae TaxID=2486419 RepID=A0A438AGJ1_9RHOB|nr:superoxide dismutase family protein [Mesobaculum littorinae]RVV97687.1 superoxide dismutase family protein [Mesobaculum littorinae]